LLQSELFALELVTKELKISPNTTWLGYPKNIEVNGKECASYTVSNVILLARRRKSHVPKEVKDTLKEKKKMLKEKAKIGDNTSNGGDNASSNLEESSLSESEMNENSIHSQLLSTPSVNVGKRSRSPVPFAGKKKKLSKYVKKYDYPKWEPPSITMEQYFQLSQTKTTEEKEEEDEEEEEEEEVNFLTSPVMSSPVSTPHGGSLLSRMFRKKDKKQKNMKPKKKKQKHEKNYSNNSEDINNKSENDDEENNEEDNENEDEKDNDVESSEVVSEKERENSISQTDKEEIEKTFDTKSIYQQSTFVINQAPVHKTMKTFKLMFAISNDFGLTVDEMITILDAAAPASKLVRKLKEFLEIKMPPGFPVQLELPLYNVLKATVTFQNFKEMEIGDEVFVIPEDYLLVDKDNEGIFEHDN